MCRSHRLARGLALATVVAASLACASPAQAVFFNITTRGGIGAGHALNWNTVGGPNTDVSNPFTINTQGSPGTYTATVSKAGNVFRRVNQGTGWSGNFAPGAPLLWTNRQSTQISIRFNQAHFGGGAQIQRDTFGAFSGRIEALGQSGNVLHTFVRAGNSTTQANDSAIFIGITSDTANIWGFRFSLTDNNQSFAINQFSLRAVPEPGTLALGGLTCLSLMGYGWRRRPRKEPEASAS